MPLVDVLQRFWDLVVANPIAFLSVGVAVGTVSAAVTRRIDSAELGAVRERLEAARDEVVRLRRDLDGAQRSGASAPHPQAPSLTPGSPGAEPAHDLAPPPATRTMATVAEAEADEGNDEKEDEDEPPVLDDEEVSILELVAEADGESVGTRAIAQHLDVHRQKALHLCERLEGLDLLWDEGEWSDEDHYFSLTREGRRYLAEEGLLD